MVMEGERGFKGDIEEFLGFDCDKICCFLDLDDEDLKKIIKGIDGILRDRIRDNICLLEEDKKDELKMDKCDDKVVKDIEDEIEELEGELK